MESFGYSTNRDGMKIPAPYARQAIARPSHDASKNFFAIEPV
jgi:hypothetical protein